MTEQLQKGTAYRESGRWNPNYLIRFLGLGAGAGLVLGAIYSIFTFYNPFPYFSVVGTLLLAKALGMAVKEASKAAHVRSRWVRFAGGLLTGLSAEYAAWVIVIRLLFPPEVPTILNPLEFGSALQQIAEAGYYSLGTIDVRGNILWGFWGIEFAIVVVGTALSSFSAYGVYSEASGGWCTEERDVVRLRGNEYGFLKKLGEQRYGGLMDNVEFVAEGVYPYIRVDLFVPPKEHAAHYLSAVLMSRTDDGKDIETELLEPIEVPSRVVMDVRSRAAPA